MSDDTPMMAQYARVKERHPDAIVFFRLGDFYEMFRGDAKEASAILGLTLTSRQSVPMCGVPHHAARTYIGRLIKAGRKVAICEQVRMPDGKGLAERQVVEVVTPGTVIDEDFLEAGTNNYLVSAAVSDSVLSVAYIDLSTGELGLSSASLEQAGAHLRRTLARLQPREMLVQLSLLDEESIARAVEERSGMLVNRLPDWQYNRRASHERLHGVLGVLNLKAFGIDAGSPLPLAAGVLLDYVQETAGSVVRHIRTLTVDRPTEHVGLDESTLRNLELVHNLHDGSHRYTLLETLGYTRTSMGTRMLRRWLLSPMRDRDAILGRQRQVAHLHRRQRELGSVRDALARVLDLERLAARVAMERAHAKDLVALGSSLSAVMALYAVLQEAGAAELRFCAGLNGNLLEVSRDLAARISGALVDEPSTSLTEGGMIREGYCDELDRLRSVRQNSRTLLEEYVAAEREETGISTLKVRFNRVIGHYLEVTKMQAARVPERFIRRQSVANAERFTTERLSDLESSINDAAERVVDLERDLFLELRAVTAGRMPVLLAVAELVSELDVLQCLAHAATVHGYTAPEIASDECLDIVAGRHPVVEAHLGSGDFVPNSISLDPAGTFFALITGPNMAGKSTFLRQTALIVLMAQIGSFVPADSARIGVVDRIFCRVGASDNLARGESTFLVEMNEAAFILRTATSASLVIMDEIGRGTGTNDGMAIAQAVTEYLLHSIRPRTLFATHFHELTALTAPGLCNLSLRVAEEGERIVFLKRVQPGPSNNSYGLHVARLAGLPTAVISRAREILEEILARTEPETSRLPAPRFDDDRRQAALFDPGELIVEELRSLDLDRLRPVDALARLSRWKDELGAGSG